ncbi:MAG: LysM peptidoglycan-binding domain-containing protein [Bacteroidota bacterium]
MRPPNPMVLTLVIWYCLLCNMEAITGDSLRYLTAKDTIFLQANTNHRKIFEHTFETGQTLYSLAHFYGLQVEDLKFYNPYLKKRAVAIGDKIKIPIANRMIIRYQEDDFAPQNHVPIYYVVQKGETLYRIAKTYFRMDVEFLMMRNALKSEQLKVGQRLHIGWLSLEGFKAEELKQYRSNNPLVQQNEQLRQQYLAEGGNKKEREHRGLALRSSYGKLKTGFVALHSYAPLHSIIMVRNPSTKRSVYLRVVGRVPNYTKEEQRGAKVVIPNEIAQLLGVVNPRFFAVVKYH